MRTPAWHELLVLMVFGPDLPLRGRIRRHAGDAQPAVGWVGSPHEPHPAFVRGTTDVVVAWRDGPRLRVEDADGRILVIADGERAWSFEHDQDRPDERPPRGVRLDLSGSELLERRAAQEWLGDDFTRATRAPSATVFVGREAWELELAPPRRKPHPIQLVVDAATGSVLQQRIDALGAVTEWTELTVGEPLEPGLFTWTGLVRSWDEQCAETQAAREAEEEAIERRPLEVLGRRTVTLTLELQLAVHHVEDDGTVHAHVDGVGSLQRRPRGTPVDPPDDDGSDTVRWSDDRWDWTLQALEHDLSPDGLAALRQQLASGGTTSPAPAVASAARTRQGRGMTTVPGEPAVDPNEPNEPTEPGVDPTGEPQTGEPDETT